MLHIVSAPPARAPKARLAAPRPAATSPPPQTASTVSGGGGGGGGRVSGVSSAPQPPKHIPKRRQAQDDRANDTLLAVDKRDPSKAMPLPHALPLSATPPAGALTAHSFGELPLDPYLQRQLQRLGLDSMTPVQRRTIPLALSGGDLVVRSPTGARRLDERARWHRAVPAPCSPPPCRLGQDVRVRRPAGAEAPRARPGRSHAVRRRASCPRARAEARVHPRAPDTSGVAREDRHLWPRARPDARARGAEPRGAAGPHAPLPVAGDWLRDGRREPKERKGAAGARWGRHE